MPKKVMRNRLSEHLAIKARREDRKISHRDIVKETGVAKATVALYLQNKATRYSARVVTIFCEYLGIRPEDFFTWDDIEGTDESKLIDARLPLPA